MSYLYKTVDNRTEKGLKESERLQRNGWTLIRGSLFLSETLLWQKLIIKHNELARN